MIFIYNINTIKNIDIKYPDIYFTPEYGECCEYSDNSIWELCKYKDLIFVYLKKKLIIKFKLLHHMVMEVFIMKNMKHIMIFLYYLKIIVIKTISKKSL